MNRKLTGAYAALALLVAAALLVNFTRKEKGSVDFTDGQHWLCTKCQNGFSTSREEYAAWLAKHPGQLPQCPKCGATATIVAKKCPLPDCGKYNAKPFLVIEGKVCCPACRKPIP